MEVPNELQELINTLETTKIAIKKYKDGFTYDLHIVAFGHSFKLKCLNSYTALKKANNYTGDNGFCNIVTNNKNLEGIELSSGEVYIKL